LKKKFWIGTIAAALLLVLANSAWWVHRAFFDTATFTATTKAAVLSESSRDAIAGRIIDQVLQKRPQLKEVIDEPATKIISGVLNSKLAGSAVDTVTGRAQIALTSPHPTSIEFDLTGIKSTLQRVVDLSGKTETKVDPNDIPDRIVLLDQSKIPPVYQIGVALQWAAPLALIGALVLLAWPYRRRRDRSHPWQPLGKQGLVIAAGGTLALLAGPLLKPLVLGAVATADGRTVVENVFTAFQSSYNGQMFILIALGAVMALTALGWWYVTARR
jgi:hypothetical protein